jgi:hypothetical protein
MADSDDDDSGAVDKDDPPISDSQPASVLTLEPFDIATSGGRKAFQLGLDPFTDDWR